MIFSSKRQSLIGAILLAISSNMTLASAGSEVIPSNYTGLSIGSVNTGLACDGLAECKENSTTWKIYSGVKFSDQIMLEGAYINFGEQQGSSSGTDTNFQANLKGYTTAAVAYYPVNDDIHLFGKAGMFWWESEVKNTAGNSATFKDNNLFFGAGATYQLGDNLALRAEWERFEDIEQGRDAHLVDLLSVGASFSSL